ncbi:uncharacterized protein LOC110844848 isoform X2 [Folsomia candida]|uniref:uncharacterized protein LOC110844848 isoform X2 n=1 Tax=Folsomia candida TaxID=158441 RepID=UPI000B902BB1|nr:uncharacterized protein LOC110844848 isoform X2 [Folsomia candida]
MSSSRTPASGLSRKDSERIYLEILRLEKERAVIKAKQAEEAAAKRAQFENDVGRKFFNKVMAKRKARLAAEQGEADAESGADKPLLFSSLINSMTSQNNNEKSSSGGGGGSVLPGGCNQSSSSPNSSANNYESSGGNRRNLEISLQIEPDHISAPIPRITDRMQAIPPEPVKTPTIVCPKGFKGFKFVNNFTLQFTPAECCGGPRNVNIYAKDQDEKCLCFGRIDSETEVFLQKQSDDKAMEELLGLKYDSATKEWTISFPELETVAYMVRPKPASRVSAAQVYEIFSAEGSSNYFNLGVEMEKSGNSRRPDFVFRILNSNLATVGTVILLSNFKVADVTIDGSLWPSQKAVILAVALYMSWDVVQDIRRKAAWVRVLIAAGIILTILTGILLVNIYLLRRED